MKRKYDSIIFDMDGVLVSNDAYRKAIQKNSSGRVMDDTVSRTDRTTGIY
jgi:beta-phosphoglucomutase-like phosphatase (HAD superfamily)